MADTSRTRLASRDQRRRADLTRGWVFAGIGFVVFAMGVALTVWSALTERPYLGFTAGIGIGLVLMIRGRMLLRRWRRGVGRFSVLRVAMLLVIYGASFGAAAMYFAVTSINQDLPQDLTTFLDMQPNRKSVVLSSDGEEIGAFAIENRRIVSLDRMPPHVPAAFLSAEDRRFYKHPGFDLVGIVRAAWKNFRSSGIKQGGSTITQQIIKQTLLVGEEGELDDLGLTPEALAEARKTQKYKRKMKEIILAYRVERELTKPEILSLYLNHVYLGHGAYGVGAAAETYFGKEVEDLTIAEAAMLAGLVASPTKYAPHRNMELARQRQKYVLGHMREDKYISDAEYETALAEPIALVDESDLNHLASPYFVEYVRRLATRRYGNSKLFKGGLRFYSTLDTQMQAAAEGALRKGLESLDRRLGFRGPIGSVPQAQRGAWTEGPAHPLTGASDDTSALADQLLPEQRYGAMVVELGKSGSVIVDLGPKRLPLVDKDAKDVRAWRGEDKQAGQTVRLGDLVAVRLTPDGDAAQIAQRPALQGALVAIEPATGRVVALVGGYDWTASQFDRVTQAKRQVGSTIKPWIYAAAIEAGKTPVDTMVDSPFSVTTATGTWTPANYDNKYKGHVTLMTALAYSLNTISVQIAVQVGLDRIIEILRGFGIQSAIPRHISISLGTPDLTPLEIASGYAGIVNGGRQVTPRFFDLVTNTSGETVDDLRDTPPGPQVISPEVAYVLTNMLKQVVQRGTAKYAGTIGRPAGGKTGTSANYRDVWFTGFTADLLCAVWIGRDDSTPIGDKITGGGAAVPIWVDFMQKAHPRTPVRDFPPPDNVSFARVEPWGGNPVRPSPTAVWMPFVRGSLPQRFLTGQPVRSFDDLVPPPPLPRPTTKCSSLSCL